MHRMFTSAFILLVVATMAGSASGQRAAANGNESPTTRPATTQPAGREPLVVTEKVAASADDDAIYDPTLRRTRRTG